MPPVDPERVSLWVMIEIHFEAMRWIARHVERDEAAERGGLLFGPTPNMISRALPVVNAAEDRRSSFAIDPAELAKGILLGEGIWGDFLGTYHSHPNGRADLSPPDVRLAEATGLLLVIGLGDKWGWKLYDARARGEVGFTILPPSSKKSRTFHVKLED